LKIIVCVKQVPDTTEVRIDPATGTLIRDGVPSIMNPDDKAALEAALRLKDAMGAEVTALSMGPTQAETVLREALAMGADSACLLTDPAFGGADTLATSTALAAAIRTMAFDLILTGRQAIDGDTAQVGPQLAELLGLPNVSYAEHIELDGNDGGDNALLVQRQFEDRAHLVRVKMPCLITALSELNAPRYMTPGGIFAAWSEGQIRRVSRKDLDVADDEIGLKGSPTRVAKSFPRSLKPAGVKTCGLTPSDAADAIAARLAAYLAL
jgi:electron transfer flavoprotein beta subunit